jgi:hypothetical protein
MNHDSRFNFLELENTHTLPLSLSPNCRNFGAEIRLTRRETLPIIVSRSGGLHRRQAFPGPCCFIAVQEGDYHSVTDSHCCRRLGCQPGSKFAYPRVEISLAGCLLAVPQHTTTTHTTPHKTTNSNAFRLFWPPYSAFCIIEESGVASSLAAASVPFFCCLLPEVCLCSCPPV